MATYELQGGEIYASLSLGGGQIFASPSLGGGEIYPGGGGGGGNLQPSKSVSYTPTESAQSATVTPDYGYDGMEEVSVSVGAIPSDYVGSDIPLCDSSDVDTTVTDNNLIRSHSVDVDDGYYENPVSLLNPFGTATFSPVGTPHVDPSTGDLTVQFKADAAGMAYTKSSYSITEEGAFNVKGAQTYTPGTTDQTISSGYLLTGNQTILGDADLVASNIKKDVNIFGVVGTYEGGGGTDYLEKKLNLSSFSYASDAVTKIPGYGMRGTTSMTSLSLPNCTSIGQQGLYGCSGMTSAYLPKVTSVEGYAFSGCNHLVTLVLPSFTTASTATNRYENCTRLTGADLRQNVLRGADFAGCSALTTLVLRKTGSVVNLPNVNALSNTPFKSGGSGGTIYVPNSLLASYPTATNWATYYGYGTITFKSIESTHTDPDAPIDLTLYYLDGTPIS